MLHLIGRISQLTKFRFSVIAVMSRSYNQGLKKQCMNI